MNERTCKMLRAGPGSEYSVSVITKSSWEPCSVLNVLIAFHPYNDPVRSDHLHFKEKLRLRDV